MNLANRITLLRIGMIPFFMILIQLGMDIWALSVFLLAAVTDFLDGYIARSRNQITNLGKFLDPLADKMLITAAFIYLTSSGLLPAWITILVLFREFAVTGLRMVLAGDIVLSASIWGKIKTNVQILVVVWLLLELPGSIIVCYLMLLITIASGVEYFINAWPALTEEGKK